MVEPNFNGQDQYEQAAQQQDQDGEFEGYD